jgi:hypothetical protein
LGANAGCHTVLFLRHFARSAFARDLSKCEICTSSTAEPRKMRRVMHLIGHAHWID